jgi:hypothetical protein
VVVPDPDSAQCTGYLWTGYVKWRYASEKGAFSKIENEKLRAKGDNASKNTGIQRTTRGLHLHRCLIS